MHESSRINRQRPMRILGSVTRDLSKMTSDPMHEMAMDLAQEHMNPAFLQLSDAVEEAYTQVSAAEFLDWVDHNPKWADAFYLNLQGLAMTAKGELLLTTWMSAEQFWQMLAEGKDAAIIAEIAARVRNWPALALDEVFLEVFELTPNTTSSAHAEIAAPVSA